MLWRNWWRHDCPHSDVFWVGGGNKGIGHTLSLILAVLGHNLSRFRNMWRLSCNTVIYMRVRPNLSRTLPTLMLNIFWNCAKCPILITLTRSRWRFLMKQSTVTNAHKRSRFQQSIVRILYDKNYNNNVAYKQTQ